MTGEVTCARSDGVAVLTLDRPDAHNALTVAMVRQFADLTAALQADPDVHVLVITGAGERAFCAGGDLAELIPRLTAGELEILFPDPAKRFLSDVFKPVIAAVNGLCLAGGLELLLGTDMRIAEASAVFGLPEVRWGLVPGGGTHVRLPQQVPWAFAMQLLLTGDHVSADRAFEVGLINEVVADGHALEASLTLARRIAQNGPLALQAAKEIAVRVLDNEPRFRLEHTINRRVVASADAREGPAAFVEKRRPQFTGK
ncbi:MAG: enoyl-CoA hydratase/isomerase family protein [Sporichthyaceae bacterium]